MDITFRMILVIALSGFILYTGESKTRIYILGLYPMSGAWPGGEGLLPATKLALDHINNNNTLLSGFELVLLDYDTLVSLLELFAYKGELRLKQKLKLSVFCALSQNYPHYFEK